MTGRKPKLTAEQRAEVYAAGELRKSLSVKALAEKYGVSKSVIVSALRGKVLKNHEVRP